MGQVEAETGYREGNAVSVKDETAFGGLAVSIPAKGDGLTFGDCAALSQLKLRYKAAAPVKLGVYTDGELRQTLTLPAQNEYGELLLSQAVSKNAELTLKLEEGANLILDTLSAYEQIEAENGKLSGGASVVQEDYTSGGAVVGGLQSPADTITMENIRSGARLKLRYKAAADSCVSLKVGDKPAVELALPKSEEYTDKSLALNVPVGSALVIAGVSGDGLFLDYLSLSGVASAEPESVSSAPALKDGGLSPVAIVGICLGAFLAAVAVVTAVILVKNKKKK